MKTLRKVYSFILLGIIIVSILMYIINQKAGISFINDGFSVILCFMIPILIIFYPYWGKSWIAILTILGRVLVIRLIQYMVVALVFNQTGILAPYSYMSSPNKTHEIIIKQYVTGLHHFTGHIKIYERVGFLFKKDIEERIYLDEDEIKLIGRAQLVEGSRFTGQKKHVIDERLVFEWIDENKIKIYWQIPEENTSEIKIVKEKLIDLSNK